ncbi:hypothetical protein [Faecalicatena contorta]|uniref:Uncharacterized protein n=1 Tax=Faecalicatena contorta TaxID=39482 RepID=A0A316A0W7_9FIRM|nr:hypothetical protein [Faecalicatena contorta]PWJ50720.1 hypothetical protein A8805_10310 [Faecalicatena contorta]SUQ13288.1 hypothetical protein SAMN05216529_10310 [Faecalicatena contorta]
MNIFLVEIEGLNIKGYNTIFDYKGMAVANDEAYVISAMKWRMKQTGHKELKTIYKSYTYSTTRKSDSLKK